MHNTLKSKLLLVGLALLALIVFGSVIFHNLEDWTWAQSIYFTVATITTVGYGDIAPSSDFSRLVTSAFILFGVGIAASFITTISSELASQRERHIVKISEKLHNRSTKAAKKVTKK